MGIHYFSNFCFKNIDCGYSLEPPGRGFVPTIYFEQKYEKISDFLSGNFQFLLVIFSIYSNRHVFVMDKNSGKVLSVYSIHNTLQIICFLGRLFTYKVYINQRFLKVVVYVIIIDQ